MKDDVGFAIGEFEAATDCWLWNHNEPKDIGETSFFIGSGVLVKEAIVSGVFEINDAVVIL
jgi:hypothetical protein